MRDEQQKDRQAIGTLLRGVLWIAVVLGLMSVLTSHFGGALAAAAVAGLIWYALSRDRPSGA